MLKVKDEVDEALPQDIQRSTTLLVRQNLMKEKNSIEEKKKT